MTVLYIKSRIHFLSYLSQFFIEGEVSQTYFVDKIKTHSFRLDTFLDHQIITQLNQNHELVTCILFLLTSFGTKAIIFLMTIFHEKN